MNTFPKALGVGNFNFRAPIAKPVMPTVPPQMNDTGNTEPKIETQQAIGGTNVRSQKRDRQITLFETSWGKLQRFEKKIEEILKEIDDPTSADYLQKIQVTLKEMQKAEIEIRGYRDQKRQKMHQLMQLEKTFSNLGERNLDLEDEIRRRDERLLSESMSATTRVIRQEDLNRVVTEHQDKVFNILKSNHHFLISENGEDLECRVCDENWEKAKLPMNERRGKVNITKFVSNNAGLHTKRSVTLRG